MTEQEIKLLEDRLGNWARWVWGDGASRARCASAEGQYTAPRADEERMLLQARAPIDTRDGAFIEEAVTSLPAVADRLFLANIYLLRRPPERIAKKLVFHVDHYDALKARTLQRLQDRIDEMGAAKLIRRGKPFYAGVAK